MYHGKFKQKKAPTENSARKRMTTVVLSTILVLTLGIGGTLALLVDKTDSITNTFTPAQVSCHVTEDFEKNTKSNVNVVNDSNITAYIRVKLVTYRVNDNGDHIGGTAEIPEFDLGTGWFEHNGYYYYSYPVAAGEWPKEALIDSDGIELIKYTDADGGKQVIEVMAEAIQSVPTSVVAENWKVNVGTDGTLTKGGNVG